MKRDGKSVVTDEFYVEPEPEPKMEGLHLPLHQQYPPQIQLHSRQGTYHLRRRATQEAARIGNSAAGKAVTKGKPSPDASTQNDPAPDIYAADITCTIPVVDKKTPEPEKADSLLMKTDSDFSRDKKSQAPTKHTDKILAHP